MDIHTIAAKHAANDDERLLLRRLLDLADRAEQSGICRCSSFLSPAERALLLRVPELKQAVDLSFAGGYPDAERTLACFCPHGASPGEAPLCVLALEYKGEPLSHRDILGALMALGIKREKMGDILTGGTRPLILCDSVIAPYICEHLDRAGRNRVRAVPAALDDIPPPRFQESSFTVLSPRLDSVVAGAFGLSRSDAAEAVRRGDVALNWQETRAAARNVAEGDRITLRGSGKVLVSRIGGQSRKGRTFVEVQKHL